MTAPAELDPRIKRTRQMLFAALESLLRERSFEEITVQDIAERSTVNRGTVYAHFKDKFALLESMVSEQFEARFQARMAGSSGACKEGVRRLILAVCDYLDGIMACSMAHQQPFAPVVEAKVRTIVRDFLLADLNRNGRVSCCAEANLRATAGAWAICGTILDWTRTHNGTPEQLAEAVLPLVGAGLLVSESSAAQPEAGHGIAS